MSLGLEVGEIGLEPQIEDGFRTSCANANMIGCDGKWAIHPSQIE
jgi:citrate lyase beta subunit